MGIRFFCPNGHKLNVKDFQAGMKGICPFCGAKIQIPTESTRSSSKRSKKKRAAKKADAPGPGAPAAAVSPAAATPSSPSQLVQPLAGTVTGPTPVQASPVGGGATGPAPQLPVGIVSPGAVAPAAAGAASPASAGPTAPAATTAAPSPAAHDPLSEAGDVVWYVRPASGGQFGPAGNEVMRGWIGEGRVSADSLVWREGWRDWQEAAEVFPQLKAAPVDSPLDQLPVTASPATVTRSARGTARRRSSATHVVAIILLIFAVMILLAVFVWVLFRDQATDSRGPGSSRSEIVIRGDFNPATAGTG